MEKGEIMRESKAVLIGALAGLLVISLVLIGIGIKAKHVADAFIEEISWEDAGNTHTYTA
ncbi:MAG: hypothetical protein LUE86_07545 [Clostridiales bacterium]|nr:hypothetical protein [Clostridiales bacterium]